MARRRQTSVALRAAVLSALSFGGLGCGETDEGAPADTTYVWALPAGFPVPAVPDDNPMSAAKVKLGRHLFYDQRLSDNGSQSCASCHAQDLAFTDGQATALGSTGEATPRGSMSLFNVAYASVFTWGNPLLFELETQVLVPLFNSEPVELGLKGNDEAMLARLRAEATYTPLFAEAFPDDPDPYTVNRVVMALASFERTLISGRSPYDRYRFDGDEGALDEGQKRGLALFESERLECSQCHGGFNLQDSVKWQDKAEIEVFFHNTGLYNLDGAGAYPAPNTGIHELTGHPEDMGKFRAPTLRNIALTAPYMHDGSIATLSEVLDHYAAGGRTIADGPYAGVGSENPWKDPLVHGFTLSPEERADLLSFLNSLTDLEALNDPRYEDPWP